MLLLNEFQRKHIILALQSTYYQEWVDNYFKLFKFSREPENRNDRIKLFALQNKLAEFETKTWSALREGKQKAKALLHQAVLSNEEKKVLSGLERHIFIHKESIRISRTIADGIAWRNLKYNRLFLQTASRGWGAGAIDSNSKGYKNMLGWALGISDHFKSVILFNDITHFLRVGDLTETDGKYVVVHELKRDGKEIRNFVTLSKKRGSVSNQTKRLLELQNIALGSKIITPKGAFNERVVNVEARTHINKIKEMITKSKKDISVTETVDDCIRISVFNFKEVFEKKLDGVKYLKPFFRDIWNPTDIIIEHSSWDSFYSDERGNFLRSMIPYSIYLLTDETCIDLISGYLLIRGELNIKLFKNILNKLRNNIF